MPYLLNESEEFLEIIGKLRKKDVLMYERVKKKITEILENPSHYKPLSNALKKYRRAHVGSFVIVFRVIEEQQIVRFVAFDHHDQIYERNFKE